MCQAHGGAQWSENWEGCYGFYETAAMHYHIGRQSGRKLQHHAGYLILIARFRLVNKYKTAHCGLFWTGSACAGSL